MLQGVGGGGIGRFTSADPFTGALDSSQGYNRYSYVNNGPLTFVDPTGYGPCFATFKTVRYSQLGSDGVWDLRKHHNYIREILEGQHEVRVYEFIEIAEDGFDMSPHDLLSRVLRP